MPETPNVVNLKNTSSKIFYREYSVDAKVPLTIQAEYYYAWAEPNGVLTNYHTVHCNVDGFFVPEDKGDYETTLSYEENACHLRVAKIDSTEPVVKLNPVKLKRTFECSENETGDFDAEAQTADVDQVIPEGIPLKRTGGDVKTDIDRKVDEFFMKRRAERGFPPGVSPHCPDCPAMLPSPDGRQDDLPETGDQETDSWIKLIQPELNRYVRHQDGYFNLPPSIVPIPCEGADEDMRKAAGLLDSSERPIAQQQDYERYKEKYHFYDIRLWPVKASCSNGKLNGEVDLWIFSIKVDDNKMALWAVPELAHVRFTALDGKPVGLMKFTSRYEPISFIEFKDPVEYEELKKIRKTLHSEFVRFEYRQADKEKDPRSVIVTNEISDHMHNDEGPKTEIELPFSAGRTQTLEFSGMRKTARYIKNKDGILDGQAIEYGRPEKSITHPASLFSRRGISPETKQCYKNGIRANADQCVDE